MLRISQDKPPSELSGVMGQWGDGTWGDGVMGREGEGRKEIMPCLRRNY